MLRILHDDWSVKLGGNRSDQPLTRLAAMLHVLILAVRLRKLCRGWMRNALSSDYSSKKLFEVQVFFLHSSLTSIFRIQRNVCRLKNIRGFNYGGNQGNIRKFFVSTSLINRFPNMLKK